MYYAVLAKLAKSVVFEDTTNRAVSEQADTYAGDTRPVNNVESVEYTLTS